MGSPIQRWWHICGIWGGGEVGTPPRHARRDGGELGAWTPRGGTVTRAMLGRGGGGLCSAPAGPPTQYSPVLGGVWERGASGEPWGTQSTQRMIGDPPLQAQGCPPPCPCHGCSPRGCPAETCPTHHSSQRASSPRGPQNHPPRPRLSSSRIRSHGQEGTPEESAAGIKRRRPGRVPVPPRRVPAPCQARPGGAPALRPLQKYRRAANGQRQHGGRAAPGGGWGQRGHTPLSQTGGESPAASSGMVGSATTPCLSFPSRESQRLRAAVGVGGAARHRPSVGGGGAACTSRCRWNSHRANYRAALTRSQRQPI